MQSSPLTVTDLSGIALAQVGVIPGHPDKNFVKIAEYIAKARREGFDVVVFPEMVLPGYLLGDRWECDAFIRDVMSYNEAVRELTQDITVIWGSVWADFDLKGEDGRARKFNTAFVAHDGKWISNGVFEGKTYKTLMPKYREFDDERHFYSMLKLAHENGVCRKYPGDLRDYLKPFPAKIKNVQRRIGVILCEDMWSDDYADDPIGVLVANGAEMIFNLSASPWTWRKNDKRHRVVKSRLNGRNVPLLYCNNVGTQNNGKNLFLFDGNSTVYAADGSLLATADDYREELLSVKIPAETPKIAPLSEERDTEELYEALLTGIRDFFTRRKNPRALIGISGGIDSTLVATLLSQALGPENVFAVNMPTKFNSSLTKNAAAKIAGLLGIHYAIVPFQDLVDLTATKLNAVVFEIQNGSGAKTSVALSPFHLENVQSRHRGATILSGLASTLGAIYTNNGNKTETALGYATLYGDVNGALAPLADLYKFEVYQLARYINKKSGQNLIPEEIFTLPPSAELSLEQNVEKGLGDPICYPYHDRLLRAWIEFRRDPENILEWHLAGNLEEKCKIPEGTIKKYFPTTEGFIADLEHKWNLFHGNYFKRIQAPMIIAVSRRAFGYDLRESDNGAYYTKKYFELKKIALKEDAKK